MRFVGGDRDRHLPPDRELPLQQWGSQTSSHGPMNQPQGVAVDCSGNVYVADTGSSGSQGRTVVRCAVLVASRARTPSPRRIPRSQKSSDRRRPGRGRAGPRCPAMWSGHHDRCSDPRVRMGNIVAPPTTDYRMPSARCGSPRTMKKGCKMDEQRRGRGTTSGRITLSTAE